MTQKIALFDLDHTLLPIDSDYEWGRFTTSLRWHEAADFAQRNDEFYAQYKAGTLDIHAYVRFATAAIRRQGAAKSIAANHEFMRLVVQKNIQPQAQALLHQHQDAGDVVVIVTATNEFVTRPIADALGVSDLIAIKLVRNPLTDWFTGEIDGTPSFREGKVTRVEQWLAQLGYSWATVDATFYSDSINDLPLLEKVAHPVATNPDEQLRAVAQKRGWRILELF